MIDLLYFMIIQKKKKKILILLHFVKDIKIYFKIIFLILFIDYVFIIKY